MQTFLGFTCLSQVPSAALTPSGERQFGQVVLKVGVEHLYQQQVEVEGLYGHPGETAEQGVVHEGRDKHTHPVQIHRGPPLGQQEGGIEQEQGPAQRYVDGDGDIQSVVSEEEIGGARVAGVLWS